MRILRYETGRYMKIHLHKGDLPDGLDLGKLVAIDTETGEAVLEKEDEVAPVPAAGVEHTTAAIEMSPCPVTMMTGRLRSIVTTRSSNAIPFIPVN